MRLIRILLTFWFFLHTLSAIAQKEAYNWIWGTCFPEFGCDGVDDGLNGTGIMKFNDDSLESITTRYFPAPFSRGSATISDSLGNFLMAFNGKTLFDSSGNELANLTSLSYDEMRVGYRGFLFLKLNDNSSAYYLLNSFNGLFSNAPNPYNNGRDTAFYINKIHKNTTSIELQESILINLPILSAGGAFDACRHANGRDWWILKCGQRKNTYLRGLLNPYDFEFEPYYTSSDSAYTSFQWASFSSDGSKYVHWFGGHIRELQVFDFDRCTGELSNLQTFDFSDIVINEWFTDFTPFSLSPDGSKLYMTRTNPSDYFVIDNFQYDLQTQTVTVLTDSLGIFSLTPNLKHMLGGFCCMNYTPTPNVPYASILKQPNELGFESEFIPFYYELPLYGFNYTPPNQANHRLGPIDGTICDSLGLNDETGWKKIPNHTLELYPNPGYNQLQVRTDLPLPLQCTLRDGQGKIHIAQWYSNKDVVLREELAELPVGLYFIEIQSLHSSERLVRKWLKME
jgi:hypothetical protein